MGWRPYTYVRIDMRYSQTVILMAIVVDWYRELGKRIRMQITKYEKIIPNFVVLCVFVCPWTRRIMGR